MFRVAENETDHVPKPSLIPESKLNSPSTPTPSATAASGAASESVERRPRRKFTVADKARIVQGAEAALRSGERGALEALMRREGVYSSQLSTWRKQFAESGTNGLAPGKPGRKPKLDAKDIQLQNALKENRRLARKLDIANLVIDLQKKAHAILGIALPEHDERNS
jgi:transposase